MADKLEIIHVFNEQVIKKWQNLLDSDESMDLEENFEERVDSFCLDFMTQAEEQELTIIAVINVPESKLTNMQHLDEKRTLANKVESLSAEKERQAELDEEPLPLSKSHELSALCEHLQRQQRISKCSQLHTQIKQHKKLLGLPPTDENLCLSHCQTPYAMRWLTALEEKFKAQVRVLIDDMRVKLNNLWEDLPYTDEFGKRRVREAQEYNMETYKVLDEELQRCREMQRRSPNLAAISSSAMSLWQTPTHWQRYTARHSTPKSTKNLRKRKLIDVDNKTDSSSAKHLTSALNSLKSVATTEIASPTRKKVMKSPQKQLLVLDPTLTPRRSTRQARIVPIISEENNVSESESYVSESENYVSESESYVSESESSESKSSESENYESESSETDSYESAPEDSHNTF